MMKKKYHLKVAKVATGSFGVDPLAALNIALAAYMRVVCLLSLLVGCRSSGQLEGGRRDHSGGD